MEESLTCPVCCDIFKNPRLLPCLHTFCEECIATFSAKAPPHLCPVCRTPYDLAPSFPLNFVANDMVEVIKLQRSCSSDESVAKMCDHCEDIEAVMVCLTCGDCLCDLHAQAHAKSKKTASHEVVEMSVMLQRAQGAASGGGGRPMAAFHSGQAHTMRQACATQALLQRAGMSAACVSRLLDC